MIASDSGRPEDEVGATDPERASGPVRIDLLFPELDAGDDARIGEIVDEAEHRTGTDPHLPLESRTHRVSFGLGEIEALYRLYRIVAERVPPDRVVVLVDDRRVPRATELWLPLLWTLLP